ncbi:hypothetical protein PTTG_02271 [Puccinia triticina 1-1 BBBD Race 1]|uniref:dihydroneopterin aldolase n=2 Tax=Puccinia triticina TaxID=208348 RepID=A0A180GTC5_PUCT1|nr:uncharacterized protein PtA15_5A301 [Puccinia triticina]OAV96057.1 hypothetical protein PTTG_02271 [Puccinia triticina 1-1 BBBD Race 1]WAQ84728.1 hypothetical protein PtA15_5A301 [Puccinia triticina]WAR58073.1 hypothetical protein PtB15_5B305 [Puccinia triticina]
MDRPGQPFAPTEWDSILIRSLSVLPRIQASVASQPSQLHPALVHLRVIPRAGFSSSIASDQLGPDTLSYFELSQTITDALSPAREETYQSAIHLLYKLGSLICDSINTPLALNRDDSGGHQPLHNHPTGFDFELAIEFPSLISLASRLSVSRSTVSPQFTRIHIQEIKTYSIIGILPHERTQKQTMLVSLLLSTCTGSSFDIQGLTRSVYEAVTESSFQTVEALADCIAKHVLAFQNNPSSKFISKVTVTVEKPEAVSCASGAGVEITRSSS